MLSNVTQSGDPAKRARSIVQAVSDSWDVLAQVALFQSLGNALQQPKNTRRSREHVEDFFSCAHILEQVSEDLGPAMVGLTM